MIGAVYSTAVKIYNQKNSINRNPKTLSNTQSKMRFRFVPTSVVFLAIHLVAHDNVESPVALVGGVLGLKLKMTPPTAPSVEPIDWAENQKNIIKQLLAGNLPDAEARMDALCRDQQLRAKLRYPESHFANWAAMPTERNVGKIY